MPDAHRIDLPQGTLDLLTMQALTREPQQGSLYRALHRLERRAWVKLTAAMARVLGTTQEIPAC